MALNRSIVLGSRKIYIYVTNLKGPFGKIYRIFRGTTLGPKIVLAEPKTRFYNSGPRLVLSFSNLVGIQILGLGILL